MWLLLTGASRYCFERAGGVLEWDKVQKLQVVSHTGMSTVAAQLHSECQNRSCSVLVCTCVPLLNA